jgi:hypothetical protein
MLGADIGSVVSGLINSGGNPTTDLAPLFAQIAASGQNERAMINQLPAQLQPLYAQYKASLGQTGANLQTATTDIGQNLLDKTQALYSPTGAPVQATLAALKQQDYSTQPGTLDALRAQLAATGGLQRGGAQSALTKAVLAPAAQYSQQAATVTGQQLDAQQSATQAAINKIAQLDDQTATQLFGMNKEQAMQILQYGRQDLQKQLSDLINQSNTETNQKLGLLGYQANQGYQNAVTDKAQQDAIVNGLVNTGVDAASMYALGGAGGGATTFPQGDTNMNMPLPNPASSVPGYGGGSGLNLY